VNYTFSHGVHSNHYGLWSIIYYFFQLKHVIAVTVALKGLGGLLFILSSSLGAYLLVCSLLNLS
jgi:hypothetical protein